MSNAQDQPGRDAGGGAPPTGTAEPTGSARQADATRGYVPRQAPGYGESGYADTRPSGAVAGLTILASVLLMLAGIWGFLEGLAAIIKGSFFVVLPNYAYSTSAVGWGWIHLILGVLVFAAGAALLMDRLWARVVAIVLVSCSTIANFLFIPYYPVWSIVVIAIDLFILWALLTPRRGWA
jgi:hypothetical protein